MGPFACPICDAKLQADESYGSFIALSNLILSAGVLYKAGFDGFRLLCALPVAWLVIEFVAINFLKYLIPPTIEIYLPKDCTLRIRGGKDQ